MYVAKYLQKKNYEPPLRIEESLRTSAIKNFMLGLAHW